ncbi:MAG TPA: MarR family transcriptional regulator [Solirubrobacteraceae bacterium]|jgi:DNA-binding MarR family transcriptional regulator|nr:MarR family transcriptional regulator [Solirubrobacteraceae bacterium]
MTEDAIATPYRFGDVLALARLAWRERMARGLASRGYDDYRRSDAAAVRMLLGGPTTVGTFASFLGISRQAARKIATGLEQRGFASATRDDADARRVNLTLTRAGRSYADAVVAVIAELNRDTAAAVTPQQLAAADVVLRAVFAGSRRAQRIGAAIPPPPAPS